LERKLETAQNIIPEISNREPKTIKEPKAEEPVLQIQRAPKVINKTESEIRLTEEQEVDDENDMFLSESLGVDLTIDSEALAQFDYDESIESPE